MVVASKTFLAARGSYPLLKAGASSTASALRLIVIALFCLSTLIACQASTIKNPSPSAISPTTGPSVATANSTAPTPPTRTAADLLRASASQMAILDSLAFGLTHETGSTSLMAGVIMTELNGQVDLPNRFTLDLKGESTGLIRSFIAISIIGSNGTVYMKDPISNQWKEIEPDLLPFDFTNLGKTLADIMASITAPSAKAGETTAGLTAIYISGTVASRDLGILIPGAADDLDVGLEVWIAEDNNMLVQARIDGPVVSHDPLGIVRVLTFGSFNKPVNINLPL